MPVFKWEGDSANGKVSGEMEASSRSAVISRLKSMGVSSSYENVREKGRRVFPLLTEGFFSRMSHILRTEIHLKSVPPPLIHTFTKNFSVMVGAGIDIAQTLEVLARQEKDARFKKIVEQTVQSVRRGESLSSALGRHPEAFSPLYTGLVKAAESGGNMAEIMTAFSDSLMKSDILKKKVRNAMIYPLTVVFASFAVLFLALSFLVPVFAQVFNDMGAPLPALTAAVVNVAAFTQSNLLSIAAVIAAAVFIPFAVYRRYERAAVFMDGLVFFIPVFGQMAHRSILSRFCGTLSSLLQSGVPLVSALEVVSRSSDNRFFSRAVMASANRMVKGRGVAESFGGNERIFPAIFLSMVEAGEQSGRLREILRSLAGSYSREADSLSAAVQSSVESVSILIVGAVVSVIVISMYLPIFSLVSLFSS